MTKPEREVRGIEVALRALRGPDTRTLPELQAPYEPGHESAGDRALIALTLMMCRNDGWLRIVPRDDGRLVYFLWKFTSGKKPQHYICYVENEYCYACGLVGLAEKLRRFDTTGQGAVKDTPYDQ